MKILVVEDCEKSALLEKKMLEKEGNKVAVAECGKDGFANAKEILPDLILLDIKLPDISGLQICKKLRDEKKTKDIPIIMVSSNDKMKDIEEAFRMGADDYIAKPFKARMLWPMIKTKVQKIRNK